MQPTPHATTRPSPTRPAPMGCSDGGCSTAVGSCPPNGGTLAGDVASLASCSAYCLEVKQYGGKVVLHARRSLKALLMAEFLGIGMTHFPRLVATDDRLADTVKRILRDPGLPDHLREPGSWPEGMREEFSDDDGLSAARQHRAAVNEGFRQVRATLDAFRPDVCIVWGDDQYENFREDIIPPFCVLAYPKITTRPWQKLARFGQNVWKEPEDKEFLVEGDPATAKRLVSGLSKRGFDVAYAYEPLHWDGLSHAFINVVLFLDQERRGFPYRLIPFQVNCYGRWVVAQHGGLPDLSAPIPDDALDPPSPQPWRCFDLGASTVRALADTDARVALIASGSWSHAFLSPRTHFLYPDLEADRLLFTALRDGDYDTWRDYPLSAIEQSGQHELLSWMCLAGAMKDLGRTPDWTEFVESYIFNSGKGFALFEG
jgi:hypothetical protein